MILQFDVYPRKLKEYPLERNHAIDFVDIV